MLQSKFRAVVVHSVVSWLLETGFSECDWHLQTKAAPERLHVTDTVNYFSIAVPTPLLLHADDCQLAYHNSITQQRTLPPDLANPTHLVAAALWLDCRAGLATAACWLH
jgi:hypothetical protein